jgi:hypothetical protein
MNVGFYHPLHNPEGTSVDINGGTYKTTNFVFNSLRDCFDPDKVNLTSGIEVPGTSRDNAARHDGFYMQTISMHYTLMKKQRYKLSDSANSIDQFFFKLEQNTIRDKFYNGKQVVSVGHGTSTSEDAAKITDKAVPFYDKQIEYIGMADRCPEHAYHLKPSVMDNHLRRPFRYNTGRYAEYESAYAYSHKINNAEQVAIDGYVGDWRFGENLKISGNRMVVSERYWDYRVDSGDGFYDQVTDVRGRVVYFDWNEDEGKWDLAGTIMSPNEGAHYFGQSLAIDGDVVVVGEYAMDDVVSNGGGFHVYKWNSTTNTYDLKLSYAIPDASADDYVGHSISLKGNIIIAGGHGEDTNGRYITGEFRVFVWDGNATVTQTQRVLGQEVSSSAGDSSAFGAYSHFDGSKLFIGEGNARAFGDATGFAGQAIGRFHVFDFDSGTNTFNYQSSAWNPFGGSGYFGIDFETDGNTLYVGALYTDFVYGNAGAVIVMEWNGTEYKYKDIIFPDANYGYIHFGSSVALKDGKLYIGARYDDPLSTNSGSIHVYDVLDKKRWRRCGVTTSTSLSINRALMEELDILIYQATYYSNNILKSSIDAPRMPNANIDSFGNYVAWGIREVKELLGKEGMQTSKEDFISIERIN